MNRSRWLKQKCKIGTWNVRSIAAGKVNTIIKDANAQKRHAGTARTSLVRKGTLQNSLEGKNNILRKGRRWPKGVAMYLTTAIPKCFIGYSPVNDRILTIRMLGQTKSIKLVHVYAPASAAEEEEVKEFYEKLQKEIDSTNTQNIFIILGDLEAMVGRNDSKKEQGIRGHFALG